MIAAARWFECTCPQSPCFSAKTSLHSSHCKPTTHSTQICLVAWSIHLGIKEGHIPWEGEDHRKEGRYDAACAARCNDCTWGPADGSWWEQSLHPQSVVLQNPYITNTNKNNKINQSFFKPKDTLCFWIVLLVRTWQSGSTWCGGLLWQPGRTIPQTSSISTHLCLWALMLCVVCKNEWMNEWALCESFLPCMECWEYGVLWGGIHIHNHLLVIGIIDYESTNNKHEDRYPHPPAKLYGPYNLPLQVVPQVLVKVVIIRKAMLPQHIPTWVESLLALLTAVLKKQLILCVPLVLHKTWNTNEQKTQGLPSNYGILCFVGNSTQSHPLFDLLPLRCLGPGDYTTPNHKIPQVVFSTQKVTIVAKKEPDLCASFPRASCTVEHSGPRWQTCRRSKWCTQCHWRRPKSGHIRIEAVWDFVVVVISFVLNPLRYINGLTNGPSWSWWSARGVLHTQAQKEEWAGRCVPLVRVVLPLWTKLRTGWRRWGQEWAAQSKRVLKFWEGSSNIWISDDHHHHHHRCCCAEPRNVSSVQIIHVSVKEFQCSNIIASILDDICMYNAIHVCVFGVFG